MVSFQRYKISNMRVDLIPIKELSEGIKRSWMSIRSSNPNLAGPCFHPELFAAAGKFISNIFVVLIYQNNNLIGLLPFLMDKRSSIADSIEFCDNQAIIGPPSQCWDMNVILKKSGLKSWEFGALVDFENIKSSRGKHEIIDSPRIDLTDGYKKYLTFLKNKKIGFGEIMYKIRLLERTIGPVRFLPICNDVEVLHKLLFWKTLRYDRNLDWVRIATGILEYIHYLGMGAFSGVLSALYAGDKIIAGCFNIRSQGILHGELISFDPDFSKYSPGRILMYYLVSELNALQCNILDCGAGKGQYKWDFSNSSFSVMTGNFKVNSFKENIKSINWLYQSLIPLVRARRKIMTNLKDKRRFN